MLAVSEATIALIVVASIGALASILAAWLTRQQRSEATPGNGMRLGGLVTHIADKLFEVDTKVDGLGVRLTEVDERLNEHIGEMAPLAENYLREHPESRKGE